MKGLVTLFLISIMLLQSMAKLSIVTNYYINQAFISATLCENISKPQLNCHGKCFLSKKLKAEEKKEQKNPSIFKGLESNTLFFYDLFSLKIIRNILFTYITTSIYLVKSYNTALNCIFQPPQ